jgi:hypothetical protein
VTGQNSWRSLKAFRLPNMVKLQHLSEFLTFSITCTGQTGLPILTRHASNDAVPPKNVPFWGHNEKNFIDRFISSLKFRNSPLIRLEVVKRMNVYGHIFTKYQPTNIKYISNYAACD